MQKREFFPPGEMSVCQGRLLYMKFLIMRSSLFWDVTQRRSVVLCLRFGTIYRSNLQESSSLRSWPKVFPKRRWASTNLRRVTSQKTEVLIFTATEARNTLLHIIKLKSVLNQIWYRGLKLLLGYGKSGVIALLKTFKLLIS